ncbi:MAG TPA: sugar transferase [Fimbriiglobus sp.]|nr:sugar transferase [Fimbriiglobus sp.]
MNNSPNSHRDRSRVHGDEGAVVPAARTCDRVKQALDYGLALLMLLAALPVVALAAVMIRITSRGPVIYSQTRLGRGGRHYRIFKLRTMYHNCEAMSGIQWATKGDARITPLGRFLRATHIDELPQLWNVLNGDMSLIGPRPERPEIARRLEEAVPGFRDRTAVKPGVTGLAQVLLPPDSDLNSVRRKLIVDRVYIGRRTWRLDLLILVGTALHVAKVPPTWILRALALPVDRSVVMEGMAANSSSTQPSAGAVVRAARLSLGEPRTSSAPPAASAPGVAG